MWVLNNSSHVSLVLSFSMLDMAGAVRVDATGVGCCQATGWSQCLFTVRSACAGVKNLLEDEAIPVGGSNHSHATQELYDSIAAGDYPEWKLLIQVKPLLGFFQLPFESFVLALMLVLKRHPPSLDLPWEGGSWEDNNLSVVPHCLCLSAWLRQQGLSSCSIDV